MIIWNDKQPIYIQIRQRIIDLILSGGAKEDEPLPSVRQIAADFSVNPLTVTKAYQSLLELEVIEKKRGVGMFLSTDARKKLLKYEKEQFINQEWPNIAKRIEALGLSAKDLITKNTRKK